MNKKTKEKRTQPPSKSSLVSKDSYILSQKYGFVKSGWVL